MLHKSFNWISATIKIFSEVLHRNENMHQRNEWSSKKCYHTLLALNRYCAFWYCAARVTNAMEECAAAICI